MAEIGAVGIIIGSKKYSFFCLLGSSHWSPPYWRHRCWLLGHLLEEMVLVDGVRWHHSGSEGFVSVCKEFDRAVEERLKAEQTCTVDVRNKTVLGPPSTYRCEASGTTKTTRHRPQTDVYLPHSHHAQPPHSTTERNPRHLFLHPLPICIHPFPSSLPLLLFHSSPTTPPTLSVLLSPTHQTPTLHTHKHTAHTRTQIV